MRVIAIIGPFRAETTAAILQNVQRAREVADQVWELGAVAYCPHTATCHLYGVLPEALFLAGHLEMLGRCDGAICVRGWQHSEGSRREVDEMWRLGLPVFETLTELGLWLMRQSQGDKIHMNRVSK